MQKQEYEAIYATQFPFWEHLNASERNRICAASSNVQYAKGEHVHDGSECKGAIVLRRGCLRAYLLSEEGREITLYRLMPGSVCVMSASCVLRTITFDVFLDAEESSDCILIPGTTFFELSEANVYVKNFALETAVSRFSEVMWVMQQILFMRLDQRLAIFFWNEVTRQQSDILRFTQEQIARDTGSAREAVSRMLKYFSAEGIAEGSRGGVRILSRTKLKALALQGNASAGA